MPVDSAGAVCWRVPLTLEGGPRKSSLHISVLELRAVWKALQSFLPFPVEKCFCALGDIVSTVVAFRITWGPCPPSSVKLGTCFCDPSSRTSAWSLNTPQTSSTTGSSLGRAHQVLGTEWFLLSAIVSASRWICSSETEQRAPSLRQHLPGPSSLEVDAFSLSWAGTGAYAYPPMKPLKEVLSQVVQSIRCVFLLAQNWPGEAWFPDCGAALHLLFLLHLSC